LKEKGSNCEILSRNFSFWSKGSVLIDLWWNLLKTLNIPLEIQSKMWGRKGEKYWENTLGVKVYKPNIRVSSSLKRQQICGNKTL
jgi:hypothetical protein